MRILPILGASIVAGFGLAFGRDLYRDAKRNWPIIVAILLATSLLVGLFYSCVWLARRYETLTWAILGRIGAAILFVVCYGMLLGIINIADAADQSGVQRVSGEIWRFDPKILDPGSIYNILFIVQNIIMLAGIAMGIKQRHYD